MYLGKNSKVRTPSPLCTHSVQKVWTSLLIWNNSNLWYQKKNKLYKWNVVKLYKWNVVVAKSMYISIYTNEKQCLPLSSTDNPLKWIAPHFQKKILSLPLLWFFKNLSRPYKQGISHYGTTIQFCSDFPHTYATLISIIKYVITKN